MPIRDLLVERLEIPVTVDNDATCATEAEWRHGAATGVSDALLITLGTGIGGGVVTRRRAAAGRQRVHVRARAHGRRPERAALCVRTRGCWERYASGSGLARLAREAARSAVAPRPSSSSRVAIPRR